MKRIMLFTLAITACLALFAQLAAAQPAFGNLYYEGTIVRTLVPSATMPFEGKDDLYVITNGGVDGQIPIAAVAPGDRDYHGGKWALWTVAWVDEGVAYLLTSADDVMTALQAGLVTVERVFEGDFKCPVQGGPGMWKNNK